MAYKTIQDNFWSDPKVKSLNFKDRYLFLYLITNAHSRMSGIYHILEAIMVEETGMQVEDVKDSLYELHKQNIIRFDPAYSVVWVVNMLRHQVPIRLGVSETTLKGIANHLKSLHQCPLIKDFLDYYYEFEIPYSYPKIDTVPPIGPKKPSEPAEDEEEEEEDENEPKNITHNDQAKEIFQYWQKITNHSEAKYSRGRKIKIRARLRAGYTVDQIKRAIENCSKSTFHMGDNPNQVLYNWIEHICKSDEKLEFFLTLHRNVQRPDGPPPKWVDEYTGKVMHLNQETGEYEEVEDGISKGDVR